MRLFEVVPPKLEWRVDPFNEAQELGFIQGHPHTTLFLIEVSVKKLGGGHQIRQGGRVRLSGAFIPDADDAQIVPTLRMAKAQAEQYFAVFWQNFMQADLIWHDDGGLESIAKERRRQIEIEGWHALNDDAHQDGQMAAAAACYALQAAGFSRPDHTNGDHPDQGKKLLWPRHFSWWKPSDSRKRNLEKAGALIAAEIDRLNRLEVAEDE